MIFFKFFCLFLFLFSINAIHHVKRRKNKDSSKILQIPLEKVTMKTTELKKFFDFISKPSKEIYPAFFDKKRSKKSGLHVPLINFKNMQVI